MGARQPRSGNITESVSREVAVGTNLCCKFLWNWTIPPTPQPHHHHHNNRRRLSLCGREHSCGQSPALLDPIRCATMHRNGSGTPVKRYPQPTDLIWMPAGSLRQLSVHQVQPAGVVFRASDGPKAFRIKRAEPGAPAKGGGRPGWVPGRFFGPDEG